LATGETQREQDMNTCW